MPRYALALEYHGAGFVGWRIASSVWIPVACGWLARRVSKHAWFHKGEGLDGTKGGGAA